MKPAFDPGDPRDGERTFDALVESLNRDSFRTRSVMVPITAYSDVLLKSTNYFHGRWPIESGEIVRSVRLIPSDDYDASRYGAYVEVSVGFFGAGTYETIGPVWNSHSNAMIAGKPIVLFSGEESLPVDTGLTVRVVRSGWPSPFIPDATVEFSIGYDGA